MRNALISICAAISLLVFTSPVMSENVKMKDNPKCKQWHSVIGEWTEDAEFRDSPTEAWKKGTSRYAFEWILDGSFLQVQGHTPTGVSFINTIGYDAQLATHVGGGVLSDGTRWTLSSAGWSGTSYRENWTVFPPGGTMFVGHCTYGYNLDFPSGMVECERFTDGEWWTDWKAKMAKMK